MPSISAVTAFTDNYIWMIHDPAGHAIAVDPGDATPVEAWLDENACTLSGILITHHHWDHTGGVAALVAHRDIPVYGPANPAIRHLSKHLRDGERVHLSAPQLDLQILGVPGHTLDHIAYYCADAGLLFCGDTLFHCGCGRLFEGQPEQMHASLQRLAALPDDTKIYCTHEYTQANMNFASAVEPDNAKLQQARRQADALRVANQPTLPSRIGDQLRINPFLRCDQPTVIAAARARRPDAVSESDIFATLRAWKDEF